MSLSSLQACALSGILIQRVRHPTRLVRVRVLEACYQLLCGKQLGPWLVIRLSLGYKHQLDRGNDGRNFCRDCSYPQR